MSIILSRSTIALILDGAVSCPSDFRAEIERDPAFWEGGELWGFPCSAGGAAIRATTGEGGICHGAGAEWGTWAVEESGLVFTADDSGVRYDAQGVEIVSEAREGDWVDCGALEYGRVAAKVDGEGVRISYTATDEHSADDVHEIRNGEVVQTVGRLEHQPTHEIDHGGITLRVCLIDGSAYARVELEFDDGADWTVNNDGEWLFQGQRVGGTVRAL